VLLEAGCGNGSNVFPLLEELPSVTMWALDVSEVAIQVGGWG
jgi:methylase of polypeptide subunit release factors